MNGRRLLTLSAFALLLGCQDEKLPTSPTGLKVPTDPSAVISDGSNGGNPDFFFLPPLVKLKKNNPDFELGQFNNTLQLSLTVQICELKSNRTGCIVGDPVETFGPGTVQLVNLPDCTDHRRGPPGHGRCPPDHGHGGPKKPDGRPDHPFDFHPEQWWKGPNRPADGFYYVLWNTGRSDLDLEKFYRINVLIDGSQTPLGFIDVDPKEKGHKWKLSSTREVIEMANGVKLPIPFRVEMHALCVDASQCTSMTVTRTDPSGSQFVTVDGGGGDGAIAGAEFRDNWLPEGTENVVVTISSVNTGSTDPVTGARTVPCHEGLKLRQFNGCFNFTTTPVLPYLDEGQTRQFTAPVRVAVCYVLRSTNNPLKGFVEMYASGPNEPAHALEDASDAGILAPNARDCSNNFVASNFIEPHNSKGVTGLASTAWRKVKGGLGRLFGVQTAYAVDLGLGGFVNEFSNIGPALTARLVSATYPDPSVLPGETATLRARIIGTQTHDGSALGTGVPGLPVKFTLTEGNGGLRPVGSEADLSSQVTTLTNSDVIFPGSEGSGGGFAGVEWTPPLTPGVYTMTVTSPVAIGVVTYHVTVRSTLAAGGIFTDRNFGIIGTAALFDPIAFRGAVQISGPPSWNGGNPINAGVYRPGGTSLNRAIWWAFVTPISGTYQAQSLSGVPVVTAPFLVDVAARNTPQLTSVSQPGSGQVQIAWTSQSNSTPCLVRVNALPFRGTVLADSVVACALHSFTFTGLPLVANGSYQVSIYEFTQDVTGTGPMGSVFDVGADDAVFVATANGPIGPLGPASPFALSTSGTILVIPPPPPVKQ